MLDMGGVTFNNPKYQLLDSQGKLVKSGKVIGNEYKIIVKDLPPSNYFLNVLEKNKPIHSFKIIIN